MKTILALSLLAMALSHLACTSQAINDTGITTKVKSKLAADRQTSALKISVETIDAVVTLTGVVPTEIEKVKAGEIARTTDGVKSVSNNITVNPASIGATNLDAKIREATDQAAHKIGEAAETTGEAVSDAAILTKIKSQFYADHIKGATVKVSKGAVTLRGTVDSPDEISKAEAIARNAKGVKRVNNHLTVTRK